MKLRCPVCHSSNSLEAFLSDDAGRELLIALSGSGPLFRPLVQYLGLFRSSSRDLTHARALKLTKEVLQILEEGCPDPQQLATALLDTVEAMHSKRLAGDSRPLKGHNYLKRVLETVALSPVASAVISADRQQAPKGKRLQAIDQLFKWAGEHENDGWLRFEIAQGLAALIGLGRKGAPGLDTVLITAGLWETLLRSKNVTIQDIDQTRIHSGFKALLSDFDGWPEPKDLLPRMPRRPERQILNATLSDEDRETGKNFFRDMQGDL